MGDIGEIIRANPVAKILSQIEQNTRSEKTAVLYKTRSELGLNKVTVKIRANIFAITDIDNEKQEFTANFAVRARWKEPRFRGKSEKEEIDWDDEWNPRLELENAMSVRNFDRKYQLRYFHTDKDDKIPHVCLTMNISATFKEMFELDEFPLDYQALNIWLISEWPFDQLELVNDDEYMDRMSLETFTESKEWKLYPQVIGEPVGEPEEIAEVMGSTEQYPIYTVTAHVKRLHQYYMWNYVFVMLLILVVNLCTFSIPETEVGQRLTTDILVLIGAFTYRNHLLPNIPNVSYWTILDKFIYSLFGCHVLIILVHAIIGGVYTRFNVSISYLRNVDLACCGGVVAIVLGIICYFTAFYFQTVQKRDKFLDEERLNFKELNDRILKKHNEKSKRKIRRYEPPSMDHEEDHSGVELKPVSRSPVPNRPKLARNVNSLEEDQLPDRGFLHEFNIPRKPNPLRGPPQMTPRSLQGGPPAPMRVPDAKMRNQEPATHEVRIDLSGGGFPPSGRDSTRDRRSRSHSRSRNKSRRPRRNQVDDSGEDNSLEAEDSQTEMETRHTATGQMSHL